MTSTRGPATAGILFLAIACCWTGRVAAARPPQPEPEALDLDQTVQDVKEQTLRLNRDLQRTEKQITCPEAACVDFYVRVDVNGFLLERVSLAVDDGAPVSHSYSASEQRALLRGGLHRIQRQSLATGAHRLHAEFAGHFADAQPTEPPLTGATDIIFRKNPAETYLIIPVRRDTRFDRPGLSEVTNVEPLARREPPSARLGGVGALAGFAPGSADDPRLGAARYLYEDDRYFSALVELLDVTDEFPNLSKVPADTLWLLADNYLSFGMWRRANEIYDALAVVTGDHVRLNQARLRVAEFLYERGYLSEATTRLRDMREKLPEALIPDWEDLLSRALMAQGRYNEAAEVLTELSNSDEQNLYTRYNLGVALLNDGRTDLGRTVLDEVGRLGVPDKELLALRDKANLTLAWNFLQNEQGGSASPVFERIRVEGPFSNRALLGMGWAELAPRGQKQPKSEQSGPEEVIPMRTFSTLGIIMRPGFFDPERYARLGLQHFRRGDHADEATEALKRALVPWIELVGRDPMDESVQEGMLAIAYALDKLGAHEQALGQYQRAIGTFETGIRRVDDAERAVKEGRMIETIVRRDIDAESGWHWQLRDLPDVPETYWLYDLIADYRYYEQLKNYRDVRMLSRNLDGWHARIGALAFAGTALPHVAPEAMIANARAGWSPPWPHAPLRLRLESRIGPGAAAPTEADLPPMRTLAASLRMSLPPPDFESLEQRLHATDGRIAALRPQLARDGTAFAQLLQTLALKQLHYQRQRLQKYMLEARFAVARIYDQQMKDAKKVGKTKGAKP